MVTRIQKFIGTASILAASLGLVACQGVAGGGGGDGELAKWQGANYMPEKNSFSQSLIAVSEFFEEEGVAKSELFHQGSLLGPEDILPGVSEGRADYGIINPFYYPGDLPLTNVASVPFITDDPWAFTTSLNEMYASNEALQAEYDKAGVHLITFVPVATTIVGTKEPIESLDDFKGTKIRAVGLLSTAMSEVGVSPVSVPAGDIYQSVEQGVIDGYTSYPFDIAVDNSFHEVAPNVLDAGTGNYSVGAILINKGKWDALTDDQKKALTDNVSTFTDGASDQITSDLEEMCDSFLEADGTPTALSGSDVKKFKDKVGDSLVEKWTKDTESSGVDAATSKQFLDDLESKIADNESKSTYDLSVGPCIAKADQK